jgi:transcriptional regulator with XRE-family HTH domain
MTLSVYGRVSLMTRPKSPRQMSSAEPGGRTFAQLLRDARHEREVSHSILQRRSGIHYSHISALERAKRGPTLETVVRIAEALEMTAAELITGLDPNDPVLMGSKRQQHKESQQHRQQQEHENQQHKER